jgi:hypothetical protein
MELNMGFGEKSRMAAWAVGTVAALAAAPSGAAAEATLTEAIAQGKPLIDLRARYEQVEDDAVANTGKAGTVRARLGYETGAWNGLTALFEFDFTRGIGSENYNSTRNGKATYGLVADPDVTELNRLQVAYAGPFDTRAIVGRQRIILGNARFVGNVGWRQHEQTFDALTLINTAVPDTTLTYVYVARVNRIFGSDTPVPNPATGAPAVGHYDSDSHLINAVYAGLPNLKFEGFAYLLDLEQSGLPATGTPAARNSTATYGLRADANFNLGADVTAAFAGQYANQSDYADNPLPIDLDYWLAEGSLGYAGATFGIGYESMEGDGTTGFSTPLATLHAFAGWADKFLTTPVDGLDDRYARLAYTTDAVPVFAKTTVALVYHDFEAERTGADLGSEWGASLDLVLDQNVSFNAKYASYRGTGAPGLLDKDVFWLSATYKY